MKGPAHLIAQSQSAGALGTVQGGWKTAASQRDCAMAEVRGQKHGWTSEPRGLVAIERFDLVPFDEDKVDQGQQDGDRRADVEQDGDGHDSKPLMRVVLKEPVEHHQCVFGEP